MLLALGLVGRDIMCGVERTLGLEILVNLSTGLALSRKMVNVSAGSAAKKATSRSSATSGSNATRAEQMHTRRQKPPWQGMTMQKQQILTEEQTQLWHIWMGHIGRRDLKN